MKQREVEYLGINPFFPSVDDFARTEAGQIWHQLPGNDLHALVAHYGHDHIAADCETGVRSLQAWLTGVNQPQPDSMYRLMFIHPDFSCDKTVLRIGFRREIRGNMKRTLERPPMGFAAMTKDGRFEAARSRGIAKRRRIDLLEKEQRQVVDEKAAAGRKKR